MLGLVAQCLEPTVFHGSLSLPPTHTLPPQDQLLPLDSFYYPEHIRIVNTAPNNLQQ